MDASQPSGSQVRTSSGSVRPHSSKSTNPDKQISQIEKSVTHLLVATKQLLETLTQWSRGNAQEEEVSDVYVRLGYEFNLACRAFNSIGVETSDLGPVPDLLRSILEDTLSQPASPQALDNYLPRIRDIIINLLHGLKRKQSKLRTRPAKDSQGKSQGVPPRQSSVTSIQSGDTGFASALESLPTQSTSTRSDSRLENLRSPDEASSQARDASLTTSLNRSSINRRSQRGPLQPPLMSGAEAESSVSSSQPSNLAPAIVTTEPDLPASSTEIPFPYAPPPPPKQDALTALQRGPDLERRASRRFSAYQIQRHLGAPPNGVPVIPPAQNSPIPNRGQENRETLNAVRSRTSFQSTRQKSNNRLHEISPSRSDSAKPQRISEERDDLPSPATNKLPSIEPPTDALGSYSPTVKTPDEYVASGASQPVLAATINGPLDSPEEYRRRGEIMPESGADEFEHDPVKSEVAAQESSSWQVRQRPTVTPPPLSRPADVNITPPQSKELTLFLQYKSKVKKFVLNEGYEELTMARLQLAFIEKFAWNTHNNGLDLPEIYVQDPVSGVRHELEDMSDVKDRSVLVLNVEVLDEVKKHFDDGIGGLKMTLESVRALLDGQGSMMQRVSDRQLQTSKEMARLSATPAPRPTWAAQTNTLPAVDSVASENSMMEIQNLRRDIAVLRQTYSTMTSDFTATMADLKTKANAVKEAAVTAAEPSYEGDAGRSHVNEGKKVLTTDSEGLLKKVDDLSDVVEDLRKDVVSRGVRPLPRQLEEISKEILTSSRQLTKLKDFIKREKPVWTKVWEHELAQVCTEREDLTRQEELMLDLGDDLEDVTEIFKLVEEAMKQQSLQANGSVAFRSPLKQLEIDTAADPRAVKDGMLDEVRALKPNHESRLEAIERAEKARQRELQSRKEGEFQREVKEFVEEGKLKKTGGMDEVERLRKLKDERAMKENWERQAIRDAEREKKRQEDAAAKAAAAAAQEQNPATDDATVNEQDNSHAETVLDEPSTTTKTLPNEPQQDDINSSAQDNPNAFSDHHIDTQQTLIEHVPEATQDSTATKLDSGPPRLPEVNINGDETYAQPTQSESEGDTDANDRGSWWKPAIFASS